MNHLKWELLDDEWFVYLVSDILAAQGFAIRPQGDGPDGGVDLFATQTISLGFDSQPFTWAVQCKFSKEPRKAVNDSEVKDVEGVLRSSRNQTLRPKGYMLLTNRLISQNVIERLRGIDDQSDFRTSALDGTRLTSLINADLKLFTKYFMELPHQTGDTADTVSEKTRGGEKSEKELLGGIKQAINEVMMAHQANRIYFPELLIMRRVLAEADREIEIMLLKQQAITEEDEKNRDIDYSDKMRGRTARERLKQMGVPIKEPR